MRVYRWKKYIVVFVLIGLIAFSVRRTDKPKFVQAQDTITDAPQGEIDPTEPPEPTDEPDPTEEPTSVPQVQAEQPTSAPVQPQLLQTTSLDAPVDDPTKIVIQPANPVSLEELQPFINQSGYILSVENGLLNLIHGSLTTAILRPVQFDTIDQTLTIQAGVDWQLLGVFPNEAVQKMVDNGFIDEVADDTGDPQSQIDLFNNRVVYKIRGVKVFKVLGLMKVPREIEVYSSIGSGNLVFINEDSWLTKIVDLLSTD